MKVHRTAFVPFIFAVVCLLAAPGASAQEGTGLTRDVLKTIQSSVKLDAQTRALMNAMTNNDVRSRRWGTIRCRHRGRRRKQDW